VNLRFQVTDLGKESLRRLHHHHPVKRPAMGRLATWAKAPGLWMAAGIGAVAFVAAGDPAQIKIFSTGGARTQEPSMLVSGTVTGRPHKRVFLSVNGMVRPVTVIHGTFQSNLPLVRGRNSIQASTDGNFWLPLGTSNSLKIAADIPIPDIWSELTWEGEGDLDLHMQTPDKQECWYQNKDTSTGAVLDVDNTVRDGPEHITMERANSGSYTISVVYYTAKTPKPVPWQLTVRFRGGKPHTYSGAVQTQGERSTAAMFAFP